MTSSTPTKTNKVKVMNDHDLNVIDEALLDPEKPEYMDHFGFTVQVKDDTEYDQDTTDSEYYEDASTSTSAATSRSRKEESEYNLVSTTDTISDEEEASVVTQKSNTNTSSAVINDDESTVLPSSVNSSIILNQQPAEDWQLVSSSVEKLNSSGNNSDSASSSPFISAKTSPAPILSYYDILLSKFSRSNTVDQAKQVQLKQETSHNLELLKNKSTKKGETDWGK
jgi:hypothetical protein